MVHTDIAIMAPAITEIAVNQRTGGTRGHLTKCSDGGVVIIVIHPGIGVANLVTELPGYHPVKIDRTKIANVVTGNALVSLHSIARAENVRFLADSESILD